MPGRSVPGIMMVDRDFQITAFNRVAQQLMGYTRDDVIGRRCYELFCDPESARICPMRRSFETGLEYFEQEVKIKPRARESMPVLVTTLPLLDAVGGIAGGVASYWPVGNPETRADRDLYDELWAFRTEHPDLRRILEKLPDIARSDTPVLLLGESGTGKSALAGAIHELSKRSGAPFAKLDCGAYRERVLEVELFGCRKSPVHGIEEDRDGRIQRAAGGTVFLQEIDLLPGYLQVKLLNFLRDGELEPLGGQHALSVDARLIAASDRSLAELEESGALREDLLNALRVFVVEIPQLRMIREAVPSMVETLIRRFNRRESKAVQRVSRKAMDLLLRYAFPGNMRELSNIVQHAHCFCKGLEIQPEHLPEQIVSVCEANGTESGRRMEEIEREIILAALERNRWNRKKTAQELGIDRTTLWRKMKKMGWGSRIRPA